MADDDDIPKRIEAVFERAGLGTDTEKIMEFMNDHEHAMTQADRVFKSKGKKFEEILASEEQEKPEEDQQ